MNPYPGLRPFRADESYLFMGREVVQSSVTTRVRISPLTLLVARSGVGKSSFLTCRVIPKLAEASQVRYRNEWGGAAANSLIDLELDSIAAVGDGREKPVLVLDQFEDVFKFPNPREPLWDKLAEIVNLPDSPVNILISMREEWLGAWGESADYLPAGFSVLIRLTPLTAQEVTRAIRRPPQIGGEITVEDELVAALLRDLKRPTAFGLGDGHVEPGLLQLVCHRLWDEASARQDKMMSVELYEKLGRADRISRDFVWNELGNAGDSASHFTSHDRVLWVGMTRHLVVAQGIKAIVDPVAMARKLRTEDLGFAGPAVAYARLPKESRAYLSRMPERRDDPPEPLVAWIADVVKKGVEVGFLKQQHGLPSYVGSQQGEELKSLFEISHDALSDIFQQFAVEFEGWIRGRWAKVAGALFGLLFVLPFFVFIILTGATFWEALARLLFFIGGLIVYFIIIWLFLLIFEFLFSLIGYPIIRKLARGIVPPPSAQGKPKSTFQEAIKHMARRLGFLPR